MKKLALTIILVFCIHLAGFAQIYIDNRGTVHDQRKQQTTTQNNRRTSYPAPKSSSSFDKSKLSIGGGIGLQFGDYTVVNISPQVGYDFSKYFTAGAGLGYTYYKDSRRYNDYKSSYLSFNLFGRFYPIEYLVIGIQPEASRMWQTVKYNGGKDSYNEFVPSFLVGGGLRLGGMIAMIQYDVVQDKNSPYGNNIFYSVGYTFRF